jgi:hypothetical protein
LEDGFDDHGGVGVEVGAQGVRVSFADEDSADGSYQIFPAVLFQTTKPSAAIQSAQAAGDSDWLAADEAALDVISVAAAGY